MIIRIITMKAICLDYISHLLLLKNKTVLSILLEENDKSVNTLNMLTVNYIDDYSLKSVGKI